MRPREAAIRDALSTIFVVKVAIFAAYAVSRYRFRGHPGPLFRVVLPAARPGVIAVAVYAFMTSWGEILFASVMTNDSTKTLSIGLQYYSTQINVYWNQVMAASLVVSVPVVVGFLLLQRYLVAGLTAGAVK